MDALSAEQVRVVLRRAAELDRSSALAPLDLDVASVEQAALEAGLSPDAVRQALAELRSGALDRPARRRLVGPRTATVCRTLPGPVENVERALHEFLRTELFDRQRDHGERTEWVRRQSIAAKVKLAVDRGIHRALVLTDIDRLSLTLTPVEEPDRDGAHVLVRMDLDVSAMVRDHAALTVIGAVAGTAVAAVSVVVTGLDPVLLATFPAGMAVGGGAHWGGARLYRRRVAEVVTGVEGRLDRLERGR